MYVLGLREGDQVVDQEGTGSKHAWILDTILAWLYPLSPSLLPPTPILQYRGDSTCTNDADVNTDLPSKVVVNDC